jgi:cytochrome P450
VSFGHGPHGCLGARLFRDQAQVALEVLFERLGELRIVDGAPLRWYRNAGNRGPRGAAPPLGIQSPCGAREPATVRSTEVAR